MSATNPAVDSTNPQQRIRDLQKQRTRDLIQSTKLINSESLSQIGSTGSTGEGPSQGQSASGNFLSIGGGTLLGHLLFGTGEIEVGNGTDPISRLFVKRIRLQQGDLDQNATMITRDSNDNMQLGVKPGKTIFFQTTDASETVIGKISESTLQHNKDISSLGTLTVASNSIFLAGLVSFTNSLSQFSTTEFKITSPLVNINSLFINLGENTGDTISLKGAIGSNYIPKTSGLHDIGSSSKQLLHIWSLGTIHSRKIELNGKLVMSGGIGNDIELGSNNRIRFGGTSSSAGAIDKYAFVKDVSGNTRKIALYFTS